jgi:hypothetical protein
VKDIMPPSAHSSVYVLLLLLLLLLAGEGDPVAVDRAPGGEACDNRRKDQRLGADARSAFMIEQLPLTATQPAIVSSCAAAKFHVAGGSLW